MPLIVLGDINIHLDNPQLVAVTKLTNLLTDVDLVQHVASVMHTANHTLDVFITRSDMQLQSLTVEPPIISDHSLITADIKFDDVVWSSTPATARRSWRSFDIDAFKEDLSSTDLAVHPPDNCDDFFALYDSTLKALLDKHAPLRQTAPRRR